jgi:ankyrin repeat protein
MSQGSLPARPDLAQLRRQAKELRDAARAGDADALRRLHAQLEPPATGPLPLWAAQLTLAREHGYASWPALKAAIEREALPRAERAERLLSASIEDRAGEARELLAADPQLARFDLRTASALGEAAEVRELLEQAPALAVRRDGTRGWTPLLYVCHSHWHRMEPARAAGMLEAARLLLDAGSDPDTSNVRPSRDGYRSALYGAAGVAGNAAITRLLLERGASPDDDESLYHAVYQEDRSILRLLVEHGAHASGTNALPAAIGRGDAETVRLLLQAGADPGRRLSGTAAPRGMLGTRELNPLPAAAALDTTEVVELLLEAGADPVAVGRDGRSALRGAVRRGRGGNAELLQRFGAPDDATVVDRFLGACASADEAAARRLLAAQPGLLGELAPDDQAALVDAADDGAGLAPLRLMLDLGFPLDAVRRSDGAQALHAAAYRGRLDVVQLLLARGAEVDARDGQWHGTALTWAAVGSGEQPHTAAGADWVATVEALLAAGAAPREAWVESKPPSEEVVALLARHGIERPGDVDDAERSDEPAGADPELERVAAELRTAYETQDLERFAAVLAEDVRWGAGPMGCSSREQVLDWYTALHARGLRAQIEEVLVGRRAIAIGLLVRRSRDDPRELIYQGFVVEHGLVRSIENLADRDAALAAL